MLPGVELVRRRSVDSVRLRRSCPRRPCRISSCCCSSASSCCVCSEPSGGCCCTRGSWRTWRWRPALLLSPMSPSPISSSRAPTRTAGRASRRAAASARSSSPSGSSTMTPSRWERAHLSWGFPTVYTWAREPQQPDKVNDLLDQSWLDYSSLR